MSIEKSNDLTGNRTRELLDCSIAPVVMYMCPTWVPILREEYRLRVFENRELRRIFGPKRYEIIGG
jgi:hypothetical protein